MRYLFLALISAASAHADIALTPKTTLHFASATEARRILVTKDDYVQRLSEFDRSARLKTDRSITVDDFLAFVGKNTLNWNAPEQQKILEAIRPLPAAWHNLHFSLPATVNLIQTTGAEEGNAAYTRGVSIVLPKSELEKDQKALTKLICHELFHVWSRQNPTLRDKLYEIIGFHRCTEVNLPPELTSHKITNPDAPKNDHFIRLAIEGHNRMAIPILLSSDATYDVKRGGEFFDYLTFVLMLVKKDAGTGQILTALNAGKPILIPSQSAPDYLQQIGTNTKYIIHPEEILADNFALLVLGEQNVPSPEILQKMKAILTNAVRETSESPAPLRLRSGPEPVERQIPSNFQREETAEENIAKKQYSLTPLLLPHREFGVRLFPLRNPRSAQGRNLESRG